MAFLIPGETITLNQDGSLSVQQRYSLPQSEVGQFSPAVPTGSGQGSFELESISAIKMEAGMAEATATWRLPNSETASGSGGNLRNVTVEIVASTSEQPISLLSGSGNFNFLSLSSQEVKDARDAADGYDTDGQVVGSAAAIGALPSDTQINLAKYYQKGVEYFLSPGVTLRLSGRTNNAVSVTNVGKAYSNSDLPVPSTMRPTIPAGGNYEWLLVSISSRSVPAANARGTSFFEVTEEYLLSPKSGWDGNIYTTGTGTIIDT
jgi:hypothetical protein